LSFERGVANARIFTAIFFLSLLHSLFRRMYIVSPCSSSLSSYVHRLTPFIISFVVL
jgi:hypothetical protein